MIPDFEKAKIDAWFQEQHEKLVDYWQRKSGRDYSRLTLLLVLAIAKYLFWHRSNTDQATQALQDAIREAEK